MRRKLTAGNWKMNGLCADLSEIEALARVTADCETLICPPATLIAPAAQRCANSALSIGAQDCHDAASGAHTGDLSAVMLADAGASHVILGHSERRTDHGETDDTVRAKIGAARAAGLTPIVCVGETAQERRSGHALTRVGEQMQASLPDDTDGSFVVAYEPIWAIGTGDTATPADITEMHTALRKGLANRFGAEIAGAIRLLYGGSVKPGNAAEIFAVENVDGALVGGASLKAGDFIAIIKALDAA